MITVGSRVKITGSDLHNCVGTVLAVRNMSAVAHHKYLVRLDEDNPKHICCGWSIDDMYPNIFQVDGCGKVATSRFFRSLENQWRIAIGNCFKNKAQAQVNVDIITKRAKRATELLKMLRDEEQ